MDFTDRVSMFYVCESSIVYVIWFLDVLSLQKPACIHAVWEGK